MKVKPLKWKKVGDKYVAKTPLEYEFTVRYYSLPIKPYSCGWLADLHEKCGLKSIGPYCQTIKEAKECANEKWCSIVKEYQKEIKLREKILSKCLEGEES